MASFNLPFAPVPTREPPSAKRSRYLAAGSPRQCFLPSCRKPFDGRCVHGRDEHYYCSEECAVFGSMVDLRRVKTFWRKTG